MVTNGIQDIALAMEGGEPETMKKPPRNPNEGIFNRLMISQIITAGASIGIISFILWHSLLNMGYNEFHSRTLVFMFMVIAENVQVFNCRSELTSVFKIPLNNNWFVVIGILAAQCIHIAAVNIPFMQNVLESDTISISEWLWLTALALILIPIIESFKWIYRHFTTPKSTVLSI